MAKKIIYEPGTYKAILSAFADLLGKNKEMKEKAGTDDYYELESELKQDLRLFLRMNFSCLNSRQLLTLCAMVSAYRPVEPFSFLITCSNLVPDL